MSPVTDAYNAGAGAACARFGLAKQAFIAKALRALETPIPGTPKLLMEPKTTAQLDASEASRRAWITDNLQGGAFRGLKRLGLDRAIQQLEPLAGDITLPPALRQQFGERVLHKATHLPVQTALGALPYGAAKFWQLGRQGVEKALNIPAQTMLGAAPAAASAGGLTKSVQKTLSMAPEEVRQLITKLRG